MAEMSEEDCPEAPSPTACAVMKCMTTADNNNHRGNGSLQLLDDLVPSGLRCPLTSQEANGISDCRP
ncbi:hypothetical protein H920_18287 [Fukomys damarensis]|uniref:Uncharacterized protein n=1 Tax=Fukomys damarensis TaxID=885580 RepID=A0A091CS94_FUKDA|nr:hypothetical protein H920_18287 [Fukomys damarensis]